MNATSLNTTTIPPVHMALAYPTSSAGLLIVLGFFIAAFLGIRFVMAKPMRSTDDKESLTAPPQQKSVKTSSAQKYIAYATLFLLSAVVLALYRRHPP
jgi:hypothetical protein